MAMARAFAVAAVLQGACAMIWGDFGQPALRPAKVFPEHALSAPTTRTSGFVVREALFSMSGEDFLIRSEEGREIFRVVGSNKVPFGLGGLVLDKLVLKQHAPDRTLCSIERRAVAMSTAYDVYDAEGAKCVAKIERDVISLTPSYKFFYEAENDGNPFYRACGSFSERRFDIYARDGSEVATIGRGLFELSDQMDTYQVRCSENVDAAAILAMCVVIDEDHDESDKARERQGARDDKKGPWPF